MHPDLEALIRAYDTALEAMPQDAVRCRDEFETLPSLSPALGTHFSGNGDFLCGVANARDALNPWYGPTITTAELPVLTRAIPTLVVPEHPGDSRYGTYTYRGSAFDYAAEPTQPFEGVVTDRQTGKPVAFPPRLRQGARYAGIHDLAGGAARWSSR